MKNLKHSREIRRKNTKRICDANRKRIFEYLSEHSCSDCGEDDAIVLQFDHVKGVKKFNVTSRLTANWTLLVAEIAKCEVVCANCHCKRTAKRSGNWYKSYLRS